MMENEKKFWVYNVTERSSVFTIPVAEPAAHAAIRLFQGAFAQDDRRAAEGKRRRLPKGIVLKLIDAESDEGRRVADERARLLRASNRY